MLHISVNNMKMKHMIADKTATDDYLKEHAEKKSMKNGNLV